MEPDIKEAFDLDEIRIAKAHSNCHIVVDGSYYSVPYKWSGSEVEVHIRKHTLEIYVQLELLRTHVRSRQKGQWQTEMGD